MMMILMTATEVFYKTNIISFLYTYITEYVGFTDYTTTQAASDIEKSFVTGFLTIDMLGLSLPLADSIELYNSETGANVVLI